MHPAVGERRFDRAPHRPQQTVDVGPGQVAHWLSRMDLRLPQDLVGQQVTDAGDRVLVEEPGFHRRGAPRERAPELLRRDGAGIGAQPVDRRVEADPAEPARVDEEQRPAIGEREGEPQEAVIAGSAATPPVVAALDFATMSIGYDDLAGHAEVNAEDRTWSARRPCARRVAPHALALPINGRQSPASQRRSDFTWPVRSAFVAVAVVDVSDHASECRLLDHRACGLYFG